MAKTGKTQFTIENCNVEAVEKEILNFLQGYHFKLISDNGDKVFQRQDPLYGMINFEYYFTYSELTILAYTNKPEKPYRIDVKGAFGATQLQQEYMDMLNDLFAHINNINNTYAGGTRYMEPGNDNFNNGNPNNGYDNNGYDNNSNPNNGYNNNSNPNNGYNANYNNNTQNYDYGNNPQQGQYNVSGSNYVNDYADKQEKKNRTMAIISFILSIAMLITSCLGVVYGALIIVLNFYMISQGMKSKFKGLAIAAMVLNICAIVVGIIVLILSFVARLN